MTTTSAAHKARFAMLAAAGLFMLALIYITRGALVPFFLGAALAYVIAPLVDQLTRLYPFASRERARGVAILTIYGAIAVTLTVLGFIFVPVISSQLSGLTDGLPVLIEDGQKQFEDLRSWYEREIPANIRMEIDQTAADAEQSVADYASGLGSSILGSVYQTAAALLGYFVIPVWLFYVLKDRSKAAESFFKFLPSEIEPDARNIVAIINQTLGSYLRAQLLLGVIVGVASTIGLYLLGVPFYVGLGVIAGFAELIPIIGPFLGVIPAIIVALAVSPEKAIWVALLYLAIQQIENNFLVPRIHGWAVRLNPAVIIILLVMANAIAGLLGMLVVIPIAAITKGVYLYIYNRLGNSERRDDQAKVLGPPDPASPQPNDASEVAIPGRSSVRR